jgi:hypothetical protein
MRLRLRLREYCHGNPGLYLGLIITGILVALTRSEGLVLVMISLLAIVIIWRGFRRGFVLVLSVVFGAALLWNQVIIPAAGIGKGSVTESMSVAFQQTARFATFHGAEITPQQKAELSDCWQNYDEIPQIYNPDTSDPVKNSFNQEKLEQYMSVYLEIGVEHPLNYLESYVASSYAYLYMGHYVCPYPSIVTFTETNLEAVFPYDYPEATEALRTALKAYAQFWSDTPVFAWLLSPAFYAWATFLCLLYLLLRNRSGLLLGVPLLLTLLIATLSPVDGYLRYVFGLVVALPLFMAFCAYTADCPSGQERKR